MTIDPSVPKDLYSLQKWFGEVIGQPILGTDELNIPIIDKKYHNQARKHLSPSPTLKSEQRIGIYNQQYWLRLIHLLHDVYPLVTRLFGYKDFNNFIAKPFLQKHRPFHWSLNYVGTHLPQWIEKHYTGEDKALILSAALLDEAYDRIFFAGAFPVTKNISDLQEAKIFLQPYVDLFAFDADFFSYREKFLEHDVAYWMKNDFPVLNADKNHFYVLYRSPDGILHEEISEAEYYLLRAFKSGSRIDRACLTLEHASQKAQLEAQKNVQEWFHNWIKWSWLTLSE